MAKKQEPYKIAFYIRVSTEEQAENPEGSIRNQEDRLRQAVAYKNSLGDFGQIHAVFIDPGISAKDMRRPELQKMLRAIRAREIDLVMVTELSRLSRNSRDFIEMWDMMRAEGCRFTSLREDFDTTTAAGEMVLFQLMNLAQFERKQTSERVTANIAARAARGLYNGGCVPVGYQTIPGKTGYLEPDPEMADVVRAAFAAFLREGSLSPTAKWLNDHGYRLKKGKQGGGAFRRMGHFTVDNLQNMLRSTAYIGVKRYQLQGELKEVKAVWPALVDTMVFQRANEILDKNRARLKPHKAGRMPYVLTGILHCKKCGSHMPGKTATGCRSKVPYYEHAWATKRDSTLSKKIFKCEPHRVPAKKLEPAVMAKILEFITSPQMAELVFEKVKALHSHDPKRKDLERVKAKIAGLGSQIEALSERLAELPKAVSAVPIYKQMEKLQTLRSEQEEALVRLQSSGVTSLDRVVGLDSFDNFAKHYKRLVTKDIGPNETKQMIQKFVNKIEVGTDSFKIHYIVDKEHYRKELALKGAGSGFKNPKFSANFSSNTLTFGTQERTRTSTPQGYGLLRPARLPVPPPGHSTESAPSKAVSRHQGKAFGEQISRLSRLFRHKKKP
jgi:site-specific DNA recombinase